jgi:hypothetical protein
LDKAKAKAGDRDLEYSDRIAAKALNEAAWNDDELIADYLGGVLAASARDDDTGAAIIAQIERLSAFQLRLHYIIYRELRRLDPQPHPNLYQGTEAQKAGIRIPVVDLAEAMAPATLAGLPGSMAVLEREGLIAAMWKVDTEDAESDNPLAFTVQARPTGVGAELFLWGHGERPPNANRIFEAGLRLTMLADVVETPCATLLSEPIANVLAAPPSAARHTNRVVPNVPDTPAPGIRADRATRSTSRKPRAAPGSAQKRRQGASTPTGDRDDPPLG